MKALTRSQFDILLAVSTTFSIVLLDRVTKMFFSDLLAYGESLPLVRNVLHMTLVHNTGIAFGFFRDQGAVFIVIPIIAIFLLGFNVYYYRQNNAVLSRVYIFAFSMILGGAIGNLVDRIVYGHVVDFIEFRLIPFPVFNIADSAITVGAILVAFKCFQLSAK